MTRADLEVALQGWRQITAGGGIGCHGDWLFAWHPFVVLGLVGVNGAAAEPGARGPADVLATASDLAFTTADLDAIRAGLQVRTTCGDCGGTGKCSKCYGTGEMVVRLAGVCVDARLLSLGLADASGPAGVAAYNGHLAVRGEGWLLVVAGMNVDVPSVYPELPLVAA